MADWSQFGDGQKVEGGGFVEATSVGTGIVSHASAHTKGSYVELIAATAHAGQWLQVMMLGAPATISTQRDFLIDLAIGAASSETVIVENLYFTQNSNAQQWVPFTLILPLEIPKGSRISARCQDSTGGGDVKLVVNVISGGTAMGPTCQRCTTLGATTADSGGTSVDPGAAAHTEGAATEFSAAIPFAAKAIAVCFGLRGNTAAGLAYFGYDILIGPATETVLIPDLCVASNTNEFLQPNCYGAIPCHIPKGTRVSVRARSSITDATDRLLDVVLYLFS